MWNKQKQLHSHHQNNYYYLAIVTNTQSIFFSEKNCCMQPCKDSIIRLVFLKPDGVDSLYRLVPIAALWDRKVTSAFPHHVLQKKKSDSIQGSVKTEHRKLLGRHYLFPIFSNVMKGPVWLDLMVLKWRPQLATVERQLGKLFLPVLQLLAVIFKLWRCCLAVSYFGCCKHFRSSRYRPNIQCECNF